MKIQVPVKKVPASMAPDDYFVRLLAEERRQMITPEHEAYIAEQQRLAEQKEEE